MERTVGSSWRKFGDVSWAAKTMATPQLENVYYLNQWPGVHAGWISGQSLSLLGERVSRTVRRL